MMTIYGKATNAKVFADIIDGATREQIQTLVNQDFMKDTKVRIMADCHAGAGCVIGTTIEIKDYIVPNLVGVDIGCGMLCVRLGDTPIDFEKLDQFIHSEIPAGMNVNDAPADTSVSLSSLRCYESLVNVNYLYRSIGSLGGGNHFIEIDQNKKGEFFLIIHTGSRNLGKQVAEIYQKKAIQYHERNCFDRDKAIRRMIEEYKATGRQKEISKEIKRLSEMNIQLSIPKELCYLEGKNFDDYMHDMDICQQFATENRYEIARRILTHLGLSLESTEHFETIHNYIHMKDRILRKGSISAYENETVLIPMNMRDGCIIARGRSNEDFNYSAPHGAGRIMSRGQAFRTVSVEMFLDSMKGIYTTTADASTLDESPFVYKPMESILDNIKDTVEVVEIIHPVYNFKSSE